MMYPDIYELEPAECFLKDVVDVDRIAIYQRVIDLLKNNEFINELDAINQQVLVVTPTRSASDVLMDIHDACVRMLSSILESYDLVLGPDPKLGMLADILEGLIYIENYDQHSVIMNIIHDDVITAVNKLFDILSLYKTFDEEDLIETIKMVGIAFFERLYEIHDTAEQRQHNQEIHPPTDDLQRHLRQLKAKYPRLLAFDYIDTGYIRPNMTADQITTIIKPYFNALAGFSYTPAETLQYSLELIGFYLMVNEPINQLPTTVKENMLQLFGDEEFISRVNTVLPATLTGLFTNG